MSGKQQTKLVITESKIEKMATKSSIHIKPCNVASSEAHNRRTAEYMRNIGKSRIYIVSELTADNEQWINPDFGSPELQTHYENIKRMVKEKTGRAMQEKERERKGKNGKIIKVAGCSPIREGVLLIRQDTTLEDVRRFGEECQRRWGITPLQIFLHKDEGHWLNGQPAPEDMESFQVGERWFKPNYHAHIVFDWMNHDTGKSRKLNDEDMTEMQNLASDILLMERGQSKAVTGKKHLERNDFIIEKQKAELQRMDAAKRHKEEPFEVMAELLQSDWHECRLCALLMLVERFKKSGEKEQKEIYDFYLTQTERINNWDLVDLSAPYIVGEYLRDKSREDLYRLAGSTLLWEQRIAVVATATLIRNNDFVDILRLSELLLHHKHDLMQKAIGWMLREMGKRNRDLLLQFLDKYAREMPRTMLRYSIEKLTDEERKHYMQR